MKSYTRPSRAKPARDSSRKQLATSREIAEIIGISIYTVYEWTKLGRIPVIRLTPRTIRYDIDAVLAALQEGAA